MLETVKRRSRWLCAVLAVLLVAPAKAHAHNGIVHRNMTDYAYEVLRAGALFNGGQLPPGTSPLAGVLGELAGDPEVAAFYAAMAAALPKLQALPSGLVNLGLPCPDDNVVPSWQLPNGVMLPDAPMGQLVHPIHAHYADTPNCALDKEWTPSGLLAAANLPTQTDANGNTHRDHTGLVLGYWATRPDDDMHDWRMRSTTLEVLQEPIVLAGIGAGVTVAVSLLCALACGLLPLLCAACPALAVGAAGVVIDGITSVNASDFEHKDFSGLGHHIDVKGPGSIHVFDDRRGKFAPGSGPTGNPDAMETLIMALFDLLGFHVNHTTSQGPKNYEILGAGDAHPDSIDRAKADWETPIAIDAPFTPLDNLAKFGWEAFKTGTPSAAATPRFGWPLHGVGDATSPMHALGTTGHGHRPYEDVVDVKFHELVGSSDTAVSAATIQAVVQRGLVWRKVIQQWRTQNGQPQEIPVRDLVTALATQTHAKGLAVPGLYQPSASLEDQFGSSALAQALYDTPAIAAFQRDTVIDGTALKLAILVSLGEVL
jgi:hypothetical protein